MCWQESGSLFVSSEDLLKTLKCLCGMIPLRGRDIWKIAFCFFQNIEVTHPLIPWDHYIMICLFAFLLCRRKPNNAFFFPNLAITLNPNFCWGNPAHWRKIFLYLYILFVLHKTYVIIKGTQKFTRFLITMVKFNYMSPVELICTYFL